MMHSNHAAFNAARNEYQSFLAVAARLKFALTLSYRRLAVGVYASRVLPEMCVEETGQTHFSPVVPISLSRPLRFAP
jgi:hypothetical protein